MKKLLLALAVTGAAFAFTGTASASPYGPRGYQGNWGGYQQRGHQSYGYGGYGYGGYRGYDRGRFIAPQYGYGGQYRAYSPYRSGYLGAPYGYGAYPYGYGRPGFSLQFNFGR